MHKKLFRTLLILILLISFGFLFSRESSKLHFLKKENKKIEESIKELEAENEDYNIQINAIKNDKKFIEKVLRKELGMIKEGEKVYKFEDK
ncbi:MAG: cell division protein FtsB [Candidatus Dadabacteria bacterium]|nr:cell division protein FtsB [Candidatus Dadabacteria bacterium]NIQ14082.1 cell division protein FtsB [Candidatus Dadabacteria bacterium]